MYSGGFMMNRAILLVGLSTVLLFFSTYGIPLVNAQSSSSNNKTSNDNSASQTQNSDPFTQRGPDNNINTGSTNSPSQTNDGSTNTNDKANDGSTNTNHNDHNKGSDNSKSSDHKDSKPDNHGIPFP